ncbi:ABC transporter ATP-binding protein [Cytobacillus sp. FJAT-54145]|uniref:ABC transporter ATP-binding protein n=1 Tax=Cytobacillus spartinae TaxID=3299023 RepID=A0ABW6KJC6_9BACI
MSVVACNNLTKVYGRTKALNQLSFTIHENKITGLIGRNGAGKTTLLKIMAGFLRETSGDIKVFSEKPFNNLKVSGNLIYTDDYMNFPTSLTLMDLLKTASSFYPNWDDELAVRLFSYFSFQSTQRYTDLSKGMKSTFNMIIGLSARCPLTIFDEPTTGMDAAVRKDFYRALLKDYIDFPRTIILSSHHLNEMEDLLEDILLIKEGELCLHSSVEDMKEYAIGLSGKSNLVHQWTKDRDIIHYKNIDPDYVYIVVKNDYTESTLHQIEHDGVELNPVSANDLCIYLTSSTKGGIDDVFSRG